jgi:hypothetical protein
LNGVLGPANDAFLFWDSGDDGELVRSTTLSVADFVKVYMLAKDDFAGGVAVLVIFPMPFLSALASRGLSSESSSLLCWDENRSAIETRGFLDAARRSVSSLSEFFLFFFFSAADLDVFPLSAALPWFLDVVIYNFLLGLSMELVAGKEKVEREIGILTIVDRFGATCGQSRQGPGE